MTEKELVKRKVDNSNICVIIYRNPTDGKLQSEAYVDVTKTDVVDLYRNMALTPLVTFEYDDFIRFINSKDERADAKRVTMEEVVLLVSKHFFL